MIIKNKKRFFIIGFTFILGINFIMPEILALSNGPNYWGMGYPGNVNSDDRYTHPKEPKDYFFGGRSNPNAYDYDGSHYGTHDWVADAALRSLLDASKNPLHYLEWRWLLTPKIARNKWPAWKANYNTTDKEHEVVRSYITFLYATQMPDTKITPQLYIPQENKYITDLGGGKWIGQKTTHVFQFEVVGTSVYGFSPTNTPTVNKISLLSNEAIHCIGKTKKDANGNTISTMQPEAAACWLGALTHYIADMVVPAHLLKKSDYSHVYSSSYYHNWFENNLAYVTKWDKAYKASGGPEQGNFSWDYRKVTISPIIPLEPEIALTLMAVTTINVAYRTDGHHQHIPILNKNYKEAENSGLFINQTTYNSTIYWDWKQDLAIHGRLESIHRYFYDKVEYLLCWAVYYIACAMQYCYNEGKDESKTSDLNPDYFARNPADPSPSREHPVRDPQTKIDSFMSPNPSTNMNPIIRNFTNMSKLLSILSLAGISFLLREIIVVAF